MTKIISTVICIIILLNLASCGKDESSTFKIIDEIKYIQNRAPLWGDEPKIKLELIQRIGDVDSLGDNYHFFRPTDVVVDEEENIYVLDYGDCRIQKYDSKGKHLATIGRRGQGPGDFLSPRCMNIAGDSNIYILDSGNRKVQIFNPSGKYEGYIGMQDKFPHHLRLLFTGEFVFNFETPDDSNPALISIINKETGLIRIIGEVSAHKDPVIWNALNSTQFDIDRNDNIYVCFMNQNRIDKYTCDGKCIFRTNRPLQYEVIHRRQKSGAYQITNVARSMAVDDEERIWVVTFKMQIEELMKKSMENPEEKSELEKQMTELDVFDRNGILLCKIPLDEGNVYIRIFNDHLYIIDYGKMYISEYKIVDM
ncbi:hypothetical protein AMJ80_06060 [bacterium SM23_31]|nr:MAG: hypothetical protein AMJ80_06060 [bacterium SM23_31]